MIAYLDLPSGLSGDMFLGCLVDAGWPAASLRRVLEQMDLPSDSWSVQAENVMRGPLRATLVHVQVQEGGQHRHLAQQALGDSFDDEAVGPERQMGAVGLGGSTDRQHDRQTIADQIGGFRPGQIGKAIAGTAGSCAQDQVVTSSCWM